MTPKEKAREFVGKYVHLAKQTTGAQGTIYNSKRCALVAVDEILNNDVGYNAYDGVTGNDIWIDTEYWQKVKQEIENYGNND